jgi:uncharacterized membrane protein YtjA (UPF0391 family)
MRCVNCGTIEDSVIHENRLIERSAICLYYALIFLVVGVIAGALNLAGVSAVAVQIFWGLFLVGIVLLVIHLVTGRSVKAS